MELLGRFAFHDSLELGPVTALEFPFCDPPAAEVPATTGNGDHIGPRPYRSRKNRPCDFCRARKAACKITSAPPCVLCRSYGIDCTFNNQSKRKRSVVQHVEDGSSPSRRLRTEAHASAEDGHQPTWSQSLNSLHEVPPPETDRHRRQSSEVEADRGMSRIPADTPPLRSHASRLTSSKQGNGPKGFSFADHPTKSAVWVGESGEADPWLCRRYHYETDDDCVLSRITYQRVRSEPGAPRRDSINEDFEEPPPIFMLPDDALAVRGESGVETTILEAARKEVTDLISDDVGDRLVLLFFRFVYPYFPILSREKLLARDASAHVRALPLSLLTAIYATALPFMLYDDYLATAVVHSAPSAARLDQICWMAINHEMHTPRLSTLQACLLMLQRPPTNRYLMDTPRRWSSTAWTVSLASILGLCKSCSGWSGLPAWERRLRGRLWWATYVMDKWSFLGAGMPSHINDDDFDVPEPTLDNRILIVSTSPRQPSSASHNPQGLLSVPSHFFHLVRLTVILSDIIKAFYTIRATSQTTNNFTLSLDRAKPLRARLYEWRGQSNEAIAATRSPITARNGIHSLDATTSNPSSAFENDTVETLDGNASLRLAYIIAVMTLYRALLRAIENTPVEVNNVRAGIHAAGRAAVLAGAKECAKEAVEFAEDLRSRDAIGVWDAFWHSWSRSNFALATSFLMRVLININASTSPTREDDISDVKMLIARWRRVLRLMSGNSGNGMTSLALLRLEGDLLQEAALLDHK